MATTSPDNIRTPNPGDPYNLVPDLQVLANDTQSALVARANSYRGTFTQRDAFTTAPTGTIWSNTNGNQSVYVRQGTSWVLVGPPGDTGWISLPLMSGFSGSCRYIRNGRQVEVRFDISGSFSGDTALTDTLPAGFQASSEATGVSSVNAYIEPSSARPQAVLYFSSGTLRGTSAGLGTITRVRGSATWAVDV